MFELKGERGGFGEGGWAEKLDGSWGEVGVADGPLLSMAGEGLEGLAVEVDERFADHGLAFSFALFDAHHAGDRDGEGLPLVGWSCEAAQDGHVP